MHTRLAVLVDGFNLFHSIEALIADGIATPTVKWLNLRRLAEGFTSSIPIGARREVVSVDYFSAYARHKLHYDGGQVARHETYAKALEDQGVTCHMHSFVKHKRPCQHCTKKNKRYEEKKTDVAIAVKLMRTFMEGRADAAVIVSGDTDLVPAVEAVFQLFPDAHVWFAFPYKRHNTELQELVNGERGGSFKISSSAYLSNSFPNPFFLGSGKMLARPAKWDEPVEVAEVVADESAPVEHSI